MPTREDQISDRLDNEGRYARAQQLQDQENNPGVNTGIDQAEAYANDPANATKNIDDARQRESNSSYLAAGSVNNSWAQNYTGKKANKSFFPSKLSVKKKGPLGIIVGLILGGGFGFSMLLTPGLGIVHLKEVLTEDLSDHLSAVTVRQDQLLRAKLKKVQGGVGVCGTKISIRCKFGSMSQRELERFRNAGFEITETKTAGTGALNREKIVSMVAPNGEKINGPDDLLRSKDPQMRAYLHKAMTPKYLSFMNPTGWMKRLGVSKAPQLEGNDKESLDESFDKATSGDTLDGGSKARTVNNDNDGRGDYVLDDSGKRVYSNESNYQQLKNTPAANAPKVADVTKDTSAGSHAGNFLKSAAKGVSVIGAADTACTVYNTSRAVSAAAKVTRAAQLAAFAMVFLNTADKIKAGDAKPEEVSYLGDNLTYVDQRQTIADEKTISEGSVDIDGDGNAQVALGERNNPYYGKSAFDSAGYHVGAHNDAPILNSRDMMFIVGGGLMGTLDSVTDSILKVLQTDRDGVRGKCKTVQSWWARGAGLIAGVVAGIGSFGTSTALSIGASVAVGFAMPFLVSALADILSGKVVSSSTMGVDSGNAIFAGTAVLNGEIAKDYGMKPSSKEDFTKYLAVTQDIRQQNIETERVLAQSTPFDIYNKYSFLGSLSRSVYPMFIEAKQQPVMALLNSPLQLGGSLSKLSLSAHAASTDGFNADRLDRCRDEGYDTIGIDADVFCNVRYSLSDTELAMDPEVNVEWMISEGHITEEGEPKSDKYKEWITYCAEREDGWGETSQDDGVSDAHIGKICMENGDYSHFRIFRMDQKIDASMSGEVEQATASPESDSSTGSLVSGESKELAQQIIDSSNVTGDSRYMGQIRAVANGDNSCYINPTILQYIATMMKTYKLTISSLNRRCTGVLTASGVSSYHYREKGGHAVDFSQINGVNSTGNTAEDIKFLNDSVKVLPSGTGIGQSNCRGAGRLNLPAGFTEFNDSCNHNHIQVPVR